MAKKKPATPLLEWIASAVGLVLTLGVMAMIARDAFNNSAEMAPDIEVDLLSARQDNEIICRFLID